MASKLTAEQREALFREIDQDIANRTHSSFTSSEPSHHASHNTTTTSLSFNDVLESTRLSMLTPKPKEQVTPQKQSTAPKLPDLRASAQKYNRFGRRPSEPDYAIDTSALGRAFPDFTQVSPAEEDATQSKSIEIGRAPSRISNTSSRARNNPSRASNGTIGKLSRSNTRSPNPAMGVDAPMASANDVFDLSAAMTNSPRSTGSPLKVPKKRQSLNATQPAQGQNTQMRNASSLCKEVSEVSPPLVKTKDYGSGSSRQGSDQRQSRSSQSEKAASHRFDKDMSQTSNERPPEVDLTVRSSRFGGARNPRNLTGDSLPGRFISGQQFVQRPIQTSQKATQGQNAQDPPNSNISTQQSFAVPPLPHLNELVSGVYENGTPVFSRNGKPHVQPQQRQTSRPEPAEADDITVDPQEQDIYASLKLLEDRVAELEMERAETEVFIQELEHKNYTLESERARQRSVQRSDSAIGMTDRASDGGDGPRMGPRKLLIEKNRLESSVLALQSQIQSIDRKATVAETAFRNVSQERDAAVSQLSVAFFTVEQLKADNASLADENQLLKARLAAAQGLKENQIRQAIPEHDELPRRQETVSTAPINQEPSVPQTELGKSARRSRVSSQLPSSFERFQEKLAKRQAEREAKISSALPEGPKATGLASIEANEAQRKFSYQTQTSQAEHHPTELFLRDDRSQQTFRYQETHSGKTLGKANGHQGHGAFGAPATSRHQSVACGMTKDDIATQDVTFVSFLESDDVVNVRDMLEEERGRKRDPPVERRVPQLDNAQPQIQAPEVGQASQLGNPIVQIQAPEVCQENSGNGHAKHSSANIADRNIIDLAEHNDRSFEEADITQRSRKSNAEHNRRHSESSVLDRRKQRQRRRAENMTSAFILPDITVRHPSSGPIRQVSVGAQAQLDDIQYHNGQNCTVCQQLIQRGEPHQHQSETKRTIIIPKPVPVSKRMPEPSEYNEEPTIRPSQPPSLALATVMKGLEDELKHLKIHLSQYQDLYNSQDASMEKSRRKQVGKKIKSLMRDIEVKSDQIYALYDALEGQKQDGHELTEQEVEVTSQSIMTDATGTSFSTDGSGEDQLPDGILA